METKELVQTEKTTQKIQLIKGEFTPSEASDVIIALIDEKINFHKIQRLQLWEGNHKYETNQLDGRINELREEKRIAKEFISNTRGLGRNLKINGVLQITVAE
ncbi:hypothetical protein [uncultured Eudoraea sp.]|jgi:hypothetical protein|uniref:hypothetical protein n=1 Tax=uncultured Eudoraea sp. TaxID=1035614 RepID=UPI002632244E|nr:hypothetical protein [uncultured Eudoraea sp.]